MSVHLEEKTIPVIDLERLKKKQVNLAVFGHGNVGSILIDQIIASSRDISKRRNLELNIFAIANSTSVLLDKDGVTENWYDAKTANGIPYSINDIVEFARYNNLDNLIAIDNTANETLVANYKPLVENGFSLISSNKIGNTLSFNFYKELRSSLSENNKEYLYETNVGAGLPLIDTIKLLHLSGDNITRIKGVFSGSLSYLFNHFSERDELFSELVKEAMRKGLTEPDPREDLSGNDVGRKLLILARELDLHNELKDISIQNLVPKSLRNIPTHDFLNDIQSLDVPFGIKKKNQPKDQVFRYVGDLRGDLSKNDGAILEVKLVTVSKDSVLGRLKDTDTLFEIYTESYGEKPIVIQGAGAGAEVTARGVFGDILRLSERVN